MSTCPAVDQVCGWALRDASASIPDSTGPVPRDLSPIQRTMTLPSIDSIGFKAGVCQQPDFVKVTEPLWAQVYVSDRERTLLLHSYQLLC